MHIARFSTIAVALQQVVLEKFVEVSVSCGLCIEHYPILEPKSQNSTIGSGYPDCSQLYVNTGGHKQNGIGANGLLCDMEELLSRFQVVLNAIVSKLAALTPMRAIKGGIKLYAIALAKAFVP